VSDIYKTSRGGGANAEIARVTKERDEARQMHGKLVLDASKQLREMEARAEAAEADNAMVRDLLLLVWSGVRTDAADRRIASLVSQHGDPPGIALLRRMRSMVEQLQQLRDHAQRGLLAFHGATCSMAGGPFPSDPGECADEQCREWSKAVRGGDPDAVRPKDADEELRRLRELASFVEQWGPCPEVSVSPGVSTERRDMNHAEQIRYVSAMAKEAVSNER
jgi:hypothetical protein